VTVTADYCAIEDAAGGPLAHGHVGVVVQDDESDKPFEVQYGDLRWWYAAEALQHADETIMTNGTNRASALASPGRAALSSPAAARSPSSPARTVERHVTAEGVRKALLPARYHAGVQLHLTLDADFHALVRDVPALAQFKLEVVNAISRAVRYHPSAVQILALRAGSVIVDCFVEESDPAAAAELEAQIRSGGPLLQRVGAYAVKAVEVSVLTPALEGTISPQTEPSVPIETMMSGSPTMTAQQPVLAGSQHADACVVPGLRLPEPAPVRQAPPPAATTLRYQPRSIAAAAAAAPAASTPTLPVAAAPLSTAGTGGRGGDAADAVVGGAREWRKYYSRSGRPYYSHRTTHVTQWARPSG
jgi:hypothetical protein